MKYIWFPWTLLCWVGIKVRTYAAMCTAARTQRRATLVASSTKKTGRYENHLSGS